jgi:hypothetical protein
MNTASHDLIAARQLSTKLPVRQILNVTQLSTGIQNDCYGNAHATKEASLKIGNKIYIVSGWLVEPYDPASDSTAIIQHWWNVDAQGHHFDITPNLNPDSIYVQDIGLFQFCIDNDPILFTHVGNNLLHKNGKFEILVDTDLMLFMPVNELKTEYIYNM